MARKRTNSKVPAKGRLRDIADELFSKAVYADWGNQCAMCGRRSGLNAHHLVPRTHIVTRYDLQNGCCLCKHCHQFDAHRSPHLNAAGFILWLKEHHPLMAKWYMNVTESGTYKRFDGTTNAVYYCEVIRGLKQYVEEDEYTRIVGQRFAAWLDSQARLTATEEMTEWMGVKK